jgi:hypothetical protein
MSGSLATNLDANGNGLTALDYRRILQGFYPNPGIVKGGTVTGNSSLTYHVSPTVAVIDRGSDGTRLVYYAGGDTPAVAAGDASNRRIDVIWLKANDPDLDGGSKEVIIGVTQGTPSANPAVPALDSGQLALMEKLVQPGATNLSTGSADNRSYNYAIPYGSSIGLLGESWQRMDGTGDPTRSKHYYEQPIDFWLPTDRLIEFQFWVNYSASDAKLSEWAIQFQVDGVGLDHAASLFSSGQSWETHYASYIATVSAGSHTARIDSWLQYGSAPAFHFNGDGTHGPLWVGRRFQVWDRGVAK